METKQWNQVPEFENYEASSIGEIRRADSKKMLTLQKLNSGYMGCTLHQNGKRLSTTVHRIVAMAFLGKPANKQEANHKDGNKFNNSIENIEWVSRAENERHKYDVLKNTGKRKLTDCDVSTIRDLYLEGDESYATLSKKFGVCRATIGHIMTGRNWSGLLHK